MRKIYKFIFADVININKTIHYGTFSLTLREVIEDNF